MLPMFLDATTDLSVAYEGTYDVTLVILSYAVACLAAFCALSILRKNLHKEKRRKQKALWQSIGAIAMGVGVWAMHFIGMLAFKLPIPVGYDPVITTLSALPAVFSSWIVLKLIGGSELSTNRLIAGGVLMGSGIGLMHYSGMAGMQLNAMMYYDPIIFASSIGVAVVLSIASLYTTYYLKRFSESRPLISRSIGAIIMGLAVGTMHYTGMAATHYLDLCTTPVEISGLKPSVLVALVSIASLVIIGLTTLAGVIDYNYRAATRSATTSQAILTRVLDNTGQGYLQTDNDGVILNLNPAMSQLLDRQREQLVGRHISDFVSSPNDEKNTPSLSNSETIETSNNEVSLLRPDGKSIPCIENSTTIQDDDGEAIGAVGLFTDISEIKEREQESKSKADLVLTVLNSIIVGVVLIDQKGTIELFNHVCEKMFNYKSEDVIGRNVSILMTGADREKHDGYLASRIPTGKSRVLGVGDRELLARKKDGTRFPIELGINQITLDNKKMFVGAILDISARKNEQKRREELERELVHTSKLEAVGQLAGGIAHEINTPVQYIGDNLGFLEEEFSAILPFIKECQCIAKDATAPSVTSPSFERLKNAVSRLDVPYIEEDIPQAITQSISGINDVARIVLSMKEFSHPSGQGLSSFDLPSAINNILTISRNEWKRVARVELDFEEDLPLVQCYPGGVNQALLNIVVNAAHAIADADLKSEGEIRIKTRKVDSDVEIQISDTGIGMPDGVKKKVFEPFFTTKEVGRGTGQGLAITWDIIVKKHQGSIDVESESGHGTTFTIRLPIEGKQQRKPAE
ncbi:Bacterial signalling N terminal domain repeat protein [Verrucomicrobiia bacterium DG1235]|nr:Bacterial signalling N terminal domain repeat protein [Verrucomicrobiae bacterium DG1235]